MVQSEDRRDDGENGWLCSGAARNPRLRGPKFCFPRCLRCGPQPVRELRIVDTSRQTAALAGATPSIAVAKSGCNQGW